MRDLGGFIAIMRSMLFGLRFGPRPVLAVSILFIFGRLIRQDGTETWRWGVCALLAMQRASVSIKVSISSVESSERAVKVQTDVRLSEGDKRSHK